MQAVTVVEKVLTDLNDPDGVRWDRKKILEYLTDAQRQVVLLRPDANAETQVVKLVAGTTRQELPEGATQLLGIVRNMGNDGTVAGRPITLVERDALDAVNAAWHEELPSESIDHYSYNDKVPEVFYVTPPPADSVYVELEFGRDPVAVTDENEELPLKNIWSEPLREYVMYRAYTRNEASMEDVAKGEKHLSRFYLALGEEAKAKLVFSPNNDQTGSK